MPGKHSATKLYLQSGLHIMDLLRQSGQLRCGEQDKVEGVKNSYQDSATVKRRSDDAAMRSEGIMRKGWVWTIVQGELYNWMCAMRRNQSYPRFAAL